MGEDTPRAVLLGMLVRERGLDPDAVARLADGTGYAPPPLTEAERARLAAADLAGAPPHVLGDYPEWLDPYFARVFGDERAEEGAALASRAPLDLRVNTLKATATRRRLARRSRARADALVAARPAHQASADAKSPAIHAEPAYLKGLVEIQDEGSQLAALLAGAKPGEQVVDLCAGGGGKTLALAAADGEQGPDLRHRQRQAPPCADPRPARARRRAQRPGAHAEVGRQRARRSRRPHGPGADRRALHRHRRLAAQPRTPNGGCGRARWRCG